MSADNILIIEEQANGTFAAYDRQVEGDYDKGGGYKAFEANDEREAILKAAEYMQENIVEYGYQFVLLPQSI